MDPVNHDELWKWYKKKYPAKKKNFKDRTDKDINNDGKVDSSDEYLHKRRQAVSKAIGKIKEAAETLDEVSTEKLRDYASAALQDKNKAKADKRLKYAGKAMQTVADRDVKAAHDRKYNKMEEVDLDEAAKTNLDDYYMDVAKAFNKENPKLKLSGLGWTKKGMIAVKDMNGDEWEYNPRTRKLTLMTEAKVKPGHNAAVMARNIAKVSAVIKKRDDEPETLQSDDTPLRTKIARFRHQELS